MTVRFPADDYELLRWYARQTGSSMRRVIARAVDRHLATELGPEQVERLCEQERSVVKELIARVGERWLANGAG